LTAIFVKICGITSEADARIALAAGADAIGLNLVAGSARRVEPELARRIADAVRGRIELVGVVADLELEAAVRLRDELGLDALQLHGDESPELLQALLPRAFKAVRVGDRQDVAGAERFGGDRLLVDAKVAGSLGGTGQAFDWRLVVELARKRSLILAGGLTPETVAGAVRQVRPFGVDVASGVERSGEPRSKDPERVAAFVRAARG
jgi:phosphoribosylanthranilate isomerase